MRYLDSRDCPAWMNAVNCLLNAALCLLVWTHPGLLGDTHAQLIWFAYGAWALEQNITHFLDKMSRPDATSTNSVCNGVEPQDFK